MPAGAAGGAVLVAALTSAMVAGRPDPAGDPGPPAEPPAPAAPPAAPPGAGVTAGPDHVRGDTEHGSTRRDGEPAAVVWYRQLATLPVEDVTRMMRDGVGSDLPRDQRDRAAGVAARFAVADVSGDGRDEFPGAWAGGGATAGPARACCTDVRVLAAGASGYRPDRSLVLALVVWTATPVDGVTRLDGHQASFVFLRPAAGGGYVPVDAATVASWAPPAGPGMPPG